MSDSSDSDNDDTLWRAAVVAVVLRKRRNTIRRHQADKRRRACLLSEDVMRIVVGRAPNAHRDRTRGEKLVYEMAEDEFTRYFRVTRTTFFQLADKVAQQQCGRG